MVMMDKHWFGNCHRDDSVGCLVELSSYGTDGGAVGHSQCAAVQVHLHVHKAIRQQLSYIYFKWA